MAWAYGFEPRRKWIIVYSFACLLLYCAYCQAYVCFYTYVDRGSTVVKVLCFKSKVSGSIPASVIGIFVDTKSFRWHYDPGVDSASNRNEYREYFLGGKGGRCVRLTTYHHPGRVSRNMGTLTLLETAGPVRACNGTDLPFMYICMYISKQVCRR